MINIVSSLIPGGNMRKKLSIIPNSLTMGNMLIGFIAILIAARGDGESLATAGTLIFLSSFFDLFDGASARALRVDNPMGVQLDSLADAVSYGIAPAVISYQAYLYKMPELAPGLSWGIPVACIYPLCAVYRLARFNIGTEKKGFSGLPSPAAGIFISSMPALLYSNPPLLLPINPVFPLYVFVILYISAAFLMASKIDYKKLFTDVYRKGKMATLFTLAFTIFSILLLRMWAAFVITGIYIAAGITFYLKALLLEGGKKRKQKSLDNKTEKKGDKKTETKARRKR